MPRHYRGQVATMEQRLLDKLDRTGECWLFTGCTDPHGYGLLWDGRRQNNSRAHRVAYELWVGPIPHGHDVHHRCEVHGCCRPEHLQAMAAAEHNSMHHRHTHCAKGHPFTGVVRRGQQVCIPCTQAYHRAYSAANRDRLNQRRRDRRRAVAVRA